MKEYKLVCLNKDIKLSVQKDIEQAENVINQYVREGWTLQQVTAPGTIGGMMIGVFYREKQL